MKNKKVQITLITLLLVLIILIIGIINSDYQQPNIARDIYIGDIISLEIEKNKITTEIIKEAFTDFEVIHVKETDAYYQVDVRTFETGKYVIWLNNTQITITVESLLNETTQNAIYDGQTIVIEPNVTIPWGIILVVLIVCWILLFAYIIYTIDQPKPKEKIDAFDQAKRWIEDLDLNEQDYFVKLSHILKGYLRQKFHLKIHGYTTKEIEKYMSSKLENDIDISLVINWLNQCDYYKFSNQKVDWQSKQDMKNQLVDIITTLESKIETKIGKEADIDTDNEVN